MPQGWLSAGSKASSGNKQPLKFPNGVMRLNSSVVRKWKAQVRSKTHTNRADSGSGHLGLYGSNGESETAASLLKGKDSVSLCQHSGEGWKFGRQLLSRKMLVLLLPRHSRH